MAVCGGWEVRRSVVMLTALCFLVYCAKVWWPCVAWQECPFGVAWRGVVLWSFVWCCGDVIQLSMEVTLDYEDLHTLHSYVWILGDK